MNRTEEIEQCWDVIWKTKKQKRIDKWGKETDEITHVFVNDPSQMNHLPIKMANNLRPKWTVSSNLDNANQNTYQM